jgi:PhnB protein
MKVQPYLFFNGRCDEAIAFYKKAVGAEVGMLARFKDSPAPEQCGAGWAEKVMHAEITIGESKILLSDGRGESKTNFENFALTIIVKDPPTAERLFASLADGGKIIMPVARTFYSPAFGMLTDKFGVMWMVYVGE